MRIVTSTSLKSLIVATSLAGFGSAAAAQDATDWSGLSFSLEGGTAGDDGFAAGSAAWMFPVGNGSILVGPVVGISGYSLSHSQKAGKMVEPKLGEKGIMLDKVLTDTTTSLEHQASLGIRVASVFQSGRGLIFGEVGAERYDTTVTQRFNNFNRILTDETSGHEVGGYAAVGAEFCATDSCKMTYTGQIRYHDVTSDTSVRVGIGWRF